MRGAGLLRQERCVQAGKLSSLVVVGVTRIILGSPVRLGPKMESSFHSQSTCCIIIQGAILSIFSVSPTMHF